MNSSPSTASLTPCPGSEELRAFAVGEASATDQERIGRHVEACAACLAVLEAAGPLQGSLFALLRRLGAGKLFDPGCEADISTVACPSMAALSAPPPDGAALPPAPAGYELLAELGRGGMGVVFKARHLGLGRVVALKMIRPDYLSGLDARENAEVRARFLNEARAAARLSHENVVPVFEVGESGGVPFYSMRHVEGHSLARVVREGPVDGRQAAAYLEPVARAVQHAHEQGILHRDLKPANILLDADGRPHVTDFGLAKWLGEARELTQTGRVLGTLSYAPPEQLRDASRVREAGDVYSLGATLYHLLTGRPPFQAASQMEVLEQVRSREPVPPRQLNPAIPRDLETVALKCLQKEPGRRYASAAELADDLGRYLRHEPIRARPVGPLGRAWRWCRRRPAVATTGAVAVAALIAVAVVSLLFAAEKAADAERLGRLAREREEESRRSRRLAEDSAVLQALLVLAEAERRPGRVDEATRRRARDVKNLLGGRTLPDVIAGVQQTLAELQEAAPGDAGLAKQQRLLANVCTTLGNWAREDGRAAEGARLLQQAVTAWEHVLRSVPGDAVASNELANSLYYLGAHFRDAGRPERMEQFWKRAAAVSERIVGQDAGHAANLGFTYYNLGVAAAEKGRQDDAIAWQTRALDTLAPLHRRGYGGEKVRWFLSSAHLGRGLAWREKKEYTKALPDLERAASLTSGVERDCIRLLDVAPARAAAGDPAGAAAEAEAVLRSGTKDGELLKGAAQVFGRCAEVVATADRVPAGRRGQLREDYCGRAVALLRQSRAAGALRGAAAVQELRGDPNFAALRGDRDFQAFLRELERGDR